MTAELREETRRVLSDLASSRDGIDQHVSELLGAMADQNARLEAKVTHMQAVIDTLLANMDTSFT
jgi:ABC-type transporter Mla subunit MlaD